jgi:glucokinase
MSERLYAGIDLGGTKLLVLIADAAGNVRGDVRVPTRAEEGPHPVIARMVDATRAAATEAGLDVASLAAAAVSAPGPIDTSEGVITDPPNLPGWHDVPLARLLREQLAIPVLLENDANCGAVGEHRYGAGRGYRHMIYITVSTGIGGGIIIDDRLYAGASGAAGELGHIGVSVDGPSCGAGHVGCLEAFASGTAIANRAEEAIAAGRMARTARLAEHNPPLSAETVSLAADQGEEEAAAIIDTAGRYLGIGLASIINAFNPQAIVIGGGLTHMGERLLGPAMTTARRRAFEQSFGDARITEWQLGERCAALGAIAVAAGAREAQEAAR